MKRERQAGPDLVRAAAIVLVLAVRFLSYTGFYTVPVDSVGMLGASWVRMMAMCWAPLFLMAAGYLCCRREWSVSHYRRLLPLLSVYLVAGVICFGFTAAQTNVEFSIGGLARSLLGYTAVSDGWYVEMYLQLFLLMPFLNLAWNHGTEREQNWLVGTAVVIASVAPSVNSLFPIFPAFLENAYPFAYYLLGAWIRDRMGQEKWKERLQRKWMGWLLTLGWMGFSAVTAVLNYLFHRGIAFPYSPVTYYQSLFVLLASVCLFLCLLRVEKMPAPILRCVRAVAALSSAVFLISSVPEGIVAARLTAAVPYFAQRFLLMPVVVPCVLVLDLLLAVPVSVAGDALIQWIPGGTQDPDSPSARAVRGWTRLRQSFLCQRRPEKELSRGRKAAFWAWNLVLVLGGGAGLGVISLALAPGNYGWNVFGDYFFHPVLLGLNLLPPVLLCLLLYGVLGRAWLACGITALPVLGFTIANYFKLAFRDDPVLASDLLLIKEAGEMLGSYHLYPAPKVVFAILAAVVLGALLAALAKGRPKLPWRLIPAGLAVAAAVYAVPMYTSETLYNQNAANEHLNRFADTQVYMARGFLYPFLHSTSKLFPVPPEGYDEAAMEQMLAQYQNADIPPEKKVNIVGIMLEAFADFSGVDSIEFQQDVYAQYHALEKEGYSGILMDNIFAGDTVRTERSFLTGLLVPDYTFRQKTSSFAWYLKEQGYRTSGDHPCFQWFYNRQNTNPYLGIDQYRFVDNYYGQFTNGGVALDNIFFPELTSSILQQLEEEDSPLFSFSVSYQGHGPYTTDHCWWGEVEDYVANENLTSEARYILANYLGSVKDTIAHINEMVDTFREREEPIVLVIFGDHKPWMGNGSFVYHELGIDLTSGTQEALENYWSTRYLFWANDAAKEALGTDLQGEGPAVSPYFLMRLLFQQLGWEGDAYMQAEGQFMETFPVIHNSGFCFDAEGNLRTDLTPEEQKLVQDFRCLCYYRMHHFAYAS